VRGCLLAADPLRFDFLDKEVQGRMVSRSWDFAKDEAKTFFKPLVVEEPIEEQSLGRAAV